MASKIKKTKITVTHVPRSVQLTMVLAVVAGFLFIRPYVGTILFSALIAFMFNPVYKAVYWRRNSHGQALISTILVATLSLVLPLLIVIGVTVNQANALVSKIQSGNVNVGPAQVETVVERGTERVNKIITALPGGENVTLDKNKAAEQLKKIGTELLQGLVKFIEHASGAFFGFISTSILAFFLVASMWRYQTELVIMLKNLSPFHNDVTEKYLNRAAAMTKAMVKGQFLIALAQGFASAFSLWIVGLDYFWFFFVLLTFLSFIPLGGGILTIPIGVVMALTGNIVQGVFVILFHLLVVTNIDNLLRPRLVPKNARLNSALTLLSVFSGLALFGPAGVIYGPVVMILLITTFEMYAEYNKHIKRPLPPSLA
ncbi:MAG TPA: AI-2E family transporter [Candidatus Saccharimonadales bacterium]